MRKNDKISRWLLTIYDLQHILCHHCLEISDKWMICFNLGDSIALSSSWSFRLLSTAPLSLPKLIIYLGLRFFDSSTCLCAFYSNIYTIALFHIAYYKWSERHCVSLGIICDPCLKYRNYVREHISNASIDSRHRSHVIFIVQINPIFPFLHDYRQFLSVFFHSKRAVSTFCYTGQSRAYLPSPGGSSSCSSR